MRTSTDKYLRTIFECCFGKNETTNKELSQRLEIAPSSTSELVKRLRERGLIFQKDYGPIALTSLGYKKVLTLMKNFRLCEIWLLQDLKLPLPLIPEQAWNISDFADSMFVRKLNRYLNYPEYSPFGNAIQNDHLMINDGSQPLMNFFEGQRVIIKSFLETPQIIQQVQAKNLTLGVRLLIKNYHPNNDFLEVATSGCKLVTISKTLAADIYVKIVE